jgi:hypothetical protein
MYELERQFYYVSKIYNSTMQEIKLHNKIERVVLWRAMLDLKAYWAFSVMGFGQFETSIQNFSANKNSENRSQTFPSVNLAKFLENTLWSSYSRQKKILKIDPKLFKQVQNRNMGGGRENSKYSHIPGFSFLFFCNFVVCIRSYSFSFLL